MADDQTNVARARWSRDFLGEIAADHDEHDWTITSRQAAVLLSEMDRLRDALLSIRDMKTHGASTATVLDWMRANANVALHPELGHDR